MAGETAPWRGGKIDNPSPIRKLLRPNADDPFQGSKSKTNGKPVAPKAVAFNFYLFCGWP